MFKGLCQINTRKKNRGVNIIKNKGKTQLYRETIITIYLNHILLLKHLRHQQVNASAITNTT